MAKEYIVIECSAWMNESGFGFNYGTDDRRFDTYSDAMSHGIELVGSDDFRIGLVEDNKLIDNLTSTSLESIGEDAEALKRIAEELGLEV